MKSSIGSSLKGGVTLLLLLASACSSDGAVQTVPTAGGGSPGKAGTGGSAGSGGSSTAGSSGSSASGSGGVPSAGAAGSSAAGTGSGGLAGSAGGGGLAGTGTGGDTGGGASSGSGGEATAGGGSGGSGGTPANPCAAMDEDADMFEGHCYLKVEEATGWREARTDCEMRGGHLVTIESENRTEEQFNAENDFVTDFAGEDDVWIGATDGRQDNESGNSSPSRWITDEDIVISNWLDGEPNNTEKDCPSGEGRCWEHCAFIWQERDGQWNDEVCAFEKFYICEWDAP